MLFEDTYKTITSRSEGIYKDKGSKFIGIVLPVRTEEEVRKKLDDIKAEYHDARHHCFAYMLGANKSASRFNDDGEPSGTAGRPIMGQINSRDLTDILIVVVRYFGGTKLGIRGLINAYRSSALNAITAARIINKTVDEIYAVQFDYLMMNHVMQIMKDSNVKILSQNFNLKCRIEYLVRKRVADTVSNRLNKNNNLTVSFIRSA
jgi:uncharacterized YigZ family protein